jgi:hypothetical protein
MMEEHRCIKFRSYMTIGFNMQSHIWIIAATQFAWPEAECIPRRLSY